ncbi:MAG: hypothetical protein ACRD0W_21070 [Acidimicrobiales bacterium]
MTEEGRFVTVHVATELLAELGKWSPPVQVQIIETPGYGTGYELTFRTVAPPEFWRVLSEIGQAVSPPVGEVKPLTGVCRPCRKGDHASHRGQGWGWVCIGCACAWTLNDSWDSAQWPQPWPEHDLPKETP